MRPAADGNAESAGHAAPWRLVRSEPGTPEWNMALDEAMLVGARHLGGPVLRLYSWLGAPASFGYFQRHREVAALTPLRPLVRRPTGGGLVPHAADWTYSLVFPAGHDWYRLQATQSYEQVHAWVAAAFARLAVPAQLAPCCQGKLPGQCFVGTERFDVTVGEKKIAGAAQRRTRDGLLIQGSIQPPPGAGRGAWETHFCAWAAEVWDVRWTTDPLPVPILAAATQLAREKYSRPTYNEAR